jgi:hypothetical protein
MTWQPVLRRGRKLVPQALWIEDHARMFATTPYVIEIETDLGRLVANPWVTIALVRRHWYTATGEQGGVYQPAALLLVGLSGRADTWEWVILGETPLRAREPRRAKGLR